MSMTKELGPMGNWQPSPCGSDLELIYCGPGGNVCEQLANVSKN